MALLIRAGSRAWAHRVQGADLSEATKKRQKIEFWFVLGFMYLMLACIFAYGLLGPVDSK